MSPPLERCPPLHPYWNQARALAAGMAQSDGVRTFALRGIPAVSVSTGDPYEWGRWGWEGPERSQRLRAALADQGYLEVGEREFRSSRFATSVVVPPPLDSLTEDPFSPTRETLRSDSVIVLLTPLQAFASLIDESRGVLGAAVQSEMFHLLRAQPIDLDRLMAWARTSGFQRLRVLLPSLEAAQRIAGGDISGRKTPHGGAAPKMADGVAGAGALPGGKRSRAKRATG